MGCMGALGAGSLRRDGAEQKLEAREDPATLTPLPTPAHSLSPPPQWGGWGLWSRCAQDTLRHS